MTHYKTKILFIVKKCYSNYCHDDLHLKLPIMTGGLFNSARFIEEMLTDAGVLCKLVEVDDNNDIDRETFNFKPTHVIIEGLWVVPEKFEILTKLHPSVKWLVRIHSEIPFLAMEGVAIDWIIKYISYNKVLVAANADRAARDIKHLIKGFYPEWSECKVDQKILLLPNFYPTEIKPEKKYSNSNIQPLNIGCFGAIRPLKNQLAQAMAAIKYANKENRVLNFHMNSTRNEQGGGNNFKNIQSLFENSRHKLVLYDWMPHVEFLKILRQMDASMCVSFSETFCIVAADSANERVPLVMSKEIPWAAAMSCASPTDVDSIENTLSRVLNPITRTIFVELNHHKLVEFCEKTKDLWLSVFKK